LQTGPGAGGVSFAAEHGQGKFCRAQGQAFGITAEGTFVVVAAVDAHKGAHVFATHRQGINRDGFCRVRAHRLQGHGLAGLF